MPGHDNPTPPPAGEYNTIVEQSVKKNIDSGFLDQDIINGLNEIVADVRGILDARKSTTQDRATAHVLKTSSERLRIKSVNFVFKHYNEGVRAQHYTHETAEYIISHSNQEKISHYNRLVDKFNAAISEISRTEGKFENKILEDILGIFSEMSQLSGRTL